MNIQINVLISTHAFISHVEIPRSGMYRSYDKYVFNFGTAKQFSQGYHFTYS